MISFDHISLNIVKIFLHEADLEGILSSQLKKRYE